MELKTSQNIPVQYADFVGRRTLVNKIYARIGASRPQSVSIVGDSKIGKSALLWFLAHPETRKQFLNQPGDYIYLYIACSELDPVSLENFTRQLFKNLEPYADTIAVNEQTIFDYNYYKHQVESLHKQNKKIILFLDDFNLITLNPAFPLEFFSFLRSLANNYNMAYVTTSYEDLQKLCVSKDIEESPFFNIFTNMSLRGFDDRDLDEFFDRMCPAAMREDPAYKSRILTLAGRFPHTLQVACTMLDDSEADAESERKVFETLQDYFQEIWDRLDRSHREILKCIVTGQHIPDELKYLVRDLEKKNYVYLNGQSDARIDGLLFRHFIERRAGKPTTGLGISQKKDGIFFRILRLFGFRPKGRK